MKKLETSTISQNFQTTIKSQIRAIAALDLKADDELEWLLVEKGDIIEAGSVVVRKKKE